VQTSVLNLIREHVSAENVIREAADYRAFPLRLSYSAYGEGIRHLRDRYGALGLEAEVVDFPADGKTTFADHHFPLAWDVDEAWLRADGGAMLADYRDDPYGVVPFCADSGGEQAGVIIPEFALRERGAPADVTNIVVLLDKYPTCAAVSWALRIGCKAFVAHPGRLTDNPIQLNARRWFNDAFAEGQIDARHRTLPGFSVSPKQAAALSEQYRQHGPIPARFLVRARTYAGSIPAVTARIVGAQQPEVDFFVTAHAYEPHATNNAAGVAICLEAARVLSALVRAGKLAPPARSIRFFHGLETFGLFAYALRNREAVKRAVGGLTVDCLGARDLLGHKERLNLIRGFDFNPSFLNGLAESVLAESAQRLGLEYEVTDGYSGNDNMLQDPLLGPPWVMLYGRLFEQAGFYHTNADTIEILSPERLAEYAAFVAIVAYAAANAGEEESRLVAAEVTRRTARFCARAMDAVGQPDAVVRENAARLLAFQKTAAHLQPDHEKQISLAVETLARSVGANPKSFRRERLTGIEVKAAHMFPTRKIPGGLGLGTLPPEARQEAHRIVGGPFYEEYWHFFAPDLFWLDGKRSVRDAALAAWSLTNADWRPYLAKYVAVVEFLEKHGYVDVRRTPAPKPVTKEDIVAGLRQIGIAAGDLVMVHSSLSAFGEIVGGADTVIDALMEVIGRDGILAMPAFTCTAVGENDPPFDPKTSPAHTGKISDTFWRRPGVLRGLHPTHSFAACGERAAEFLRSRDVNDTFDRNGPFGKLYDWSGKVLCFGETMGANTYLHALEAWLLNYLDSCYARLKSGAGEREVLITHYPSGCRGGWYSRRREADYFKKLSALGLYRETKIGAATTLVINIRDLTGAMHRFFLDDPALLLHKSGCIECAYHRAKLTAWKVPEQFPAGSP